MDVVDGSYILIALGDSGWTGRLMIVDGSIIDVVNGSKRVIGVCSLRKHISDSDFGTDPLLDDAKLVFGSLSSKLII